MTLIVSIILILRHIPSGIILEQQNVLQNKITDCQVNIPFGRFHALHHVL